MCPLALFQLRVHNCSYGGCLHELKPEQVKYFSLEKKRRNTVHDLKKNDTIPTCNPVTYEGIALWIKERVESAHWPSLQNYDTNLKDNPARVYLIVCCHSRWKICKFHEWLFSSHWQFVYGQVFSVLPKNSDCPKTCNNTNFRLILLGHSPDMMLVYLHLILLMFLLCPKSRSFYFIP